MACATHMAVNHGNMRIPCEDDEDAKAARTCLAASSVSMLMRSAGVSDRSAAAKTNRLENQQQDNSADKGDDQAPDVESAEAIRPE